jgi:Bacterial Ig domain
MSTLKRQARNRSKTRRTELIVAIGSILVCFSLVAGISGSFSPSKHTNSSRTAEVSAPVPPPSPTPPLVKEYIYAGGRLVASEESANIAPTVSITSPANNTVFTAPANITLNATAGDSDGTISKVEFYQGTTLLNTDTATPFSFAWNNVPAGTYSVTAKAFDNNNAVTPSSAISVISNAAPTVSITSPANNAVFTAPANITLNATAGDSDGTISKVEFYQGTTLLNTDTATPFSFAWNNVPAGTYSVTAKAFDNNNAVTPSAAINVQVNPGCTPPVGLIISEFRLRGPNGSNDEYIELYNNSDAGITVCTADGSSGWAVVSSDGTSRFVIANGTVIPARAHYLAVAAGYSLTGYSGSTPGNLSYATDIPENSGLALFNTANAGNFTLANRFDAVGFTSASSLYREGAGLALLGANTGQYCFLRKLNSGTPQDTADNPSDVTFVATDGGVYGSLVAILGGPGPENLSSPIQRNATLPITLLDPAAGANVAPNRVRDTTAVGPNAAAGTLSIRRTITNNTGSNVTRLRFRVTDITTLNTPGYSPGGPQADMRVLSSSDFNVTITGGQQVTVRGTTLETPPAQAMGGGLHSSLSAGVISLSQPLAPGQSIRVQFLLGVQQSGSFRFFFNVEALP